jgi:hypothetical protein
VGRSKECYGSDSTSADLGAVCVEIETEEERRGVGNITVGVGKALQDSSFLSACMCVRLHVWCQTRVAEGTAVALPSRKKNPRSHSFDKNRTMWTGTPTLPPSPHHTHPSAHIFHKKREITEGLRELTCFLF